MVTAKEISTLTPATRDRTVDAIRAFSIAVVVLGHWLMAAVVWRDGPPSGENVLALVPALWVATWVLQVMPLFFFVGGFSNAVKWASVRRSGEGYAAYLRSRAERLGRPALAFAVVWVAAVAAMRVLGVPAGFRDPLAWLVAQPLWFLGVYIGVVAAAPAMIALHERHRARVPAALAAAVACTDLLHRGADVPVGALNFAFVWLFAQQLGFFLADGSSSPRSRFAAGAAGGLAGLVLLTVWGPYPVAMVTAPGGDSNVGPPTFALIPLTIWLVSAAMLLRPRLERALARERTWALVVRANMVSMTAYLWHLTALVLVVLVLYPLGFPQPEPATAAWWATRPLWLLALATFLVPLVRIFARYEMAPPRAGASGAGAVAAGAALVAVGLVAFAVAGFGSLIGSVAGLAALASGVALLGGFSLRGRSAPAVRL